MLMTSQSDTLQLLRPFMVVSKMLSGVSALMISSVLLHMNRIGAIQFLNWGQNMLVPEIFMTKLV